jgi:hypothetical protein
MACKAIFYLKATALLLTLAVSSLVGCGGSSFSAADLSDSGVTPDVTGGQSSVISSQSSVRTSTGGQSAVSSQTSVISQTGGQASDIGGRSSVTGGASGVTTVRYWTSYFNDNEIYIPYDYSTGYLSIGECAGDQLGSSVTAIHCSCTSGSNTEYMGPLDSTCSNSAAAKCLALSVGDTTNYHIFTWECPTTNSSILSSTGGSSSIGSTGGSSAIAATGGSSTVAPTSYTITYQNQVATQSLQAPGTCPSGQSVMNCSCVISGMAGSLTSCNPAACQSENSKQYPQSTFTWSCS